MIIDKYYPFENPDNYEYDGNKIKVENGKAFLREDTLAKGLVLYLKFENNLIDSSPYHHTVKVKPGHEPEGYVDSNGVLGKAIWFNNLNNNNDDDVQYVYIEHHSVFRPPKLSIVLWYYMKSDSRYNIFAKKDPLNYYREEYWICLNPAGSIPQFIIYDSNNGQYSAAGGDCHNQLNTWAMIVATLDTIEGKIEMYHRVVGGCSGYGSTDYPGGLWDPGAHGHDYPPIGIGQAFLNTDGNPDNTYYAFDGYVDNVMMYNRILTEEEVDILWNEGQGYIVSKYTPHATIRPKYFWFNRDIDIYLNIFEKKDEGSEGEIKYRFHDGEKWRYWNGSEWAEATNENHYNTLEEVKTHLSKFPATNKKMKFEAKLISPTGNEYVGLDTLSLQAYASQIAIMDYLEKVDVAKEVDFIHPKTYHNLSNIFPSGYALLNENDDLYKFMDIALFKEFRDYEKFKIVIE